MSEVRIEFLEVHFDVVGDDEQQFVRLFEKYINEWSRMQTALRERRIALDAERMVGDRRDGSER